ncbi:hypothetical protein RN001_005467 [Aquatica leii]|uniref:tubulin-glutamate carboxypeptidase n=1 Tax=Aquatica leii TaxID=1421715 RepID=A0AAN7SPV5_9COLE|nr:hypothetical protein RN001_005467 [Aquatica leii]
MDDLECAGFEFFSNFDSANLSKVEYVPPNESVVISPPPGAGRVMVPELPDVEFNLWTKPDCFGSEFQNANRTWFYFGIRANSSGLIVKLNMVDLNRQAKMYSQGMAPVYRIIPGKLQWERVRDKPTYQMTNNIFTLSFKYKTPENTQSIVYFAFTYPYSYMELTNMLSNLDNKFANKEVLSKNDIYYVREAVCFSLEGRRVELLTISSYNNISSERETRLKNLFPEEHVPRPFKFIGKKVIFVSARVHPGETPSTFVFNGLLNLLLSPENPVAVTLRKLYVFKLIPMLNPDGVAKGHYRTDTRGVNLNRVYLNPSLVFHPSIFAARALIRYHHFGFEKEDEVFKQLDLLNDNDDVSSMEDNQQGAGKDVCCSCDGTLNEDDLDINEENGAAEYGDFNSNESGLFLYLDMHGHASKKGIFMYGNHFEDFERNIECMVLPKIMSINNFNFHFTACNFTERNMYLKDRRDGMSREGSGRVAVLKLTGLIRSYTLECNYNTGRLVNALPCTIKETGVKATHTLSMPPKYTPHVFEEVGKALGASILDLTGNNPVTRLPNSQFHTLNGLREWLRIHCATELGGETRFSHPRLKLRNSSSLHLQGKSLRAVVLKSRTSGKDPKRTMPKAVRSANVPIERKENICEIQAAYPTKPTCSNVITVPRVRTKTTLNNIKNKTSMEETTLKTKGNTSNDKSKSTSNLKAMSTKVSSLKLKAVKLEEIKETELKANDENPNKLKLHEICYLKNAEGKTMIAKYKGKIDGKKGSDADLVVEWDNYNNTQVFSHRTKGYGIPPTFDSSSNKGLVRVYNFSKTVKSKKFISAFIMQWYTKRSFYDVSQMGDLNVLNNQLILASNAFTATLN